MLALLVVAQSTMFAHTMLPLSHRSNLYPATPTHSYLQRHLDGERFGASGVTLYPAGSASFYGLRTPVGHEFTQPRWWDVLLAVDPSPDLPDLQPLPAEPHRGALRQLAGTGPARGPLLGRASGTSPARSTRRRRRPTGWVCKRGERGPCEIGGGALRGVEVVAQRSRALPAGKPRSSTWPYTPRTGVGGGAATRQRLPAVPKRVAVTGEELAGGGRYPVDVWLTGVTGDTVSRAG